MGKLVWFGAPAIISAIGLSPVGVLIGGTMLLGGVCFAVVFHGAEYVDTKWGSNDNV